MKHRDDLPHSIEITESIFIDMPDGCTLVGKLWLPEGASEKPDPTILEYIPYGRRDRCSARDHEVHAWDAGHGYAARRMDIRGSGDSKGGLKDEYLKQEQETFHVTAELDAYKSGTRIFLRNWSFSTPRDNAQQEVQ